MKRNRQKNIFEAILAVGHDEDFLPRPCGEACDARPGSEERMKTLVRRAELGEELWHEEDMTLFSVLGHENRPDFYPSSCFVPFDDDDFQ